MRNRDKKSHPKLEGRIITFKNDNWKNGKIHFGRVIGCDYDIGITIVDIEDTDTKLCCLNGPASLHGKYKFINYLESMLTYDKSFEYILGVIRSNGLYDTQERRQRAGEPSNGYGEQNTCSFS
ncbi:hypothetical protein M0R04_04715 [Candidatus Dojkabacteria bacterium]|jgi:hypothetical protein|nr:hypothetical protein [Candidatus Dojkabacteria bacterium]